MIISNVLSKRSFETWPSYHLVYEWEEDISIYLSIPIVDSYNENEVFINSIYRKIFFNRYSKKFLKGNEDLLLQNIKGFLDLSKKRKLSLKLSKTKSLVFELYNGDYMAYTSAKNIIPIIIDFWKDTNLEVFYKVYKNCDIVLISSLEVFNYLKEKNCPINIIHYPLSLSDRYKLDENINYSKVYDILLAGRKNDALWSYLQEFSLKYPETEFLYQESLNGELYYKSNKKGLVGKFHSRQDYVNLLRASKIAFYSTPGIDGGEKRTGGFNPVTPRFLELLSAKCLLLGRYPDNDETRFFEVDKVCPNISSYSQFEEILLRYLNQSNVPINSYKDILEKHYTSCRAKQLVEIIEK